MGISLPLYTAPKPVRWMPCATADISNCCLFTPCLDSLAPGFLILAVLPLNSMFTELTVRGEGGKQRTRPQLAWGFAAGEAEARDLLPASACLGFTGSAPHFSLLLSIPQFPARAEPGTVLLSNINKAGLIFLGWRGPDRSDDLLLECHLQVWLNYSPQMNRYLRLTDLPSEMAECLRPYLLSPYLALWWSFIGKIQICSIGSRKVTLWIVTIFVHIS